MKFFPILFATILSLSAQLLRADAPATPDAAVPPATAPAVPVPAPPSTVPDAGFPASRYEALWVKSPFAVATSESIGDESPDYLLVGIANIDGISYASVVETKPPQEHFLISTDKPNRGMTLKSINRSHDGTATYAEVLKDGQPITLKLEQAPAVAAVGPGAPAMMNAPPQPGNMAPQIFMPGGASAFPNHGSTRPFIRFHRLPVQVPPMPVPQPQAAPPPPPQ